MLYLQRFRSHHVEIIRRGKRGMKKSDNYYLHGIRYCLLSYQNYLDLGTTFRFKFLPYRPGIIFRILGINVQSFDLSDGHKKCGLSHSFTARSLLLSEDCIQIDIEISDPIGEKQNLIDETWKLWALCENITDKRNCIQFIPEEVLLDLIEKFVA
jgi:hypothetical protein